MLLPFFGPVLVVVGLLWCFFGTIYAFPVPCTSIPFFAGLLLAGWRQRMGVALLVILVIHRGVISSGIAIDCLPLLLAVYLGNQQRSDPHWLKITGWILGLSVAQARWNRQVDYFGPAFIADLIYAGLALAGLALVLRAEKRGSVRPEAAQPGH